MPKGKAVRRKAPSLRMRDRREILKRIPKLRKIKAAKSGK